VSETPTTSIQPKTKIMTTNNEKSKTSPLIQSTGSDCDKLPCDQHDKFAVERKAMSSLVQKRPEKVEIPRVELEHIKRVADSAATLHLFKATGSIGTSPDTSVSVKDLEEAHRTATKAYLMYKAYASDD